MGYLTHEILDHAMEDAAFEVQRLPCGLSDALLTSAQRTEVF